MFILLSVIVFWGAFLLFTVELIAANALLPGFGGSYLVWSSCMVFFQGVLFLGYLYAYLYQWKLSLRRTFFIHLFLIFLPLLFFPIRLDLFQNPSYTKPMVIEIIGLLFRTIGLAFWILTTTSVMLQQYLASSTLTRNKNPYVLYATSNLGSVVALIAYPFLIAPLLRLSMQINWWQKGYMLFFVLHIVLFVFVKRLIPKQEKAHRESKQSLAKLQIFRWILLSASASAMMLAVTNTITFDLAAIPLFWILPLSIYLLSFILTFKRKIWYPLWLKDRFPFAVIIGFFLFLLMLQSYKLPVWILLIFHPLILLIVCVTCNGELNQSKPVSVVHLTLFYIIISLGSFLGSVLVSWVIPIISTSVIEYPFALLLAVLAQGSITGQNRLNRASIIQLLVLMILIVMWPLTVNVILPGKSNLLAVGYGILITLLLFYLHRRKAAFSTGLILILLFSFFIDYLKIGQHLLHKHRNFYGIYRIYEKEGKRFLQHGTTLHGSQYMQSDRRREALTYYHITAPAGELLSRFSSDISDVGLIGLGAGSLVTYISEKQSMDILELDPYNGVVAKTYFYFLKDGPGKIRLFFGDGRLNLRKRTDRKYSVLIIDAFNSDAIPVHLLTCEALSEYLDRLDPDGIILFHISNKYLDLSPVLLSNGKVLNLHVLKKNYSVNVHPDAEACEWIVLTRSSVWTKRLTETLQWTDLNQVPIRNVRPWTDQYINLLAVIR